MLILPHSNGSRSSSQENLENFADLEEIQIKFMRMKKAIVLGAGGFIGNHLVKRLKRDGMYVVAIDLRLPAYSKSQADEFLIGDLRDEAFLEKSIPSEADELYQLAADMGGAGYIFSGENDATIMNNSLQINLNVARVAVLKKVKALFFASSACIYPAFNQEDPNHPICAENTAYPALPDSEYGWEKLMSERLFQAYARNFGLNVKIARLHNVYGSECAWNNGREKAPAALCRKIVEAMSGDEIEIWGTGQQTRSFLYIEDCLEGIIQLMRSDVHEPLNIGSEEMISIQDLVVMIAQIEDKKIKIKPTDGPIGVNGRCSDNTMVKRKLGWEPQTDLFTGIQQLYRWIGDQVHKN